MRKITFVSCAKKFIQALDAAKYTFESRDIVLDRTNDLLVEGHDVIICEDALLQRKEISLVNIKNAVGTTLPRSHVEALLIATFGIPTHSTLGTARWQKNDVDVCHDDVQVSFVGYY